MNKLLLGVLFALGLACGDESVEPPSGEPCDLRGMYVACMSGDAEGRTYCDELGGALEFGPCVLDVECDLAGDQQCDMRCELIDGAPRWVAQECGGPDTSVPTL